MVKKGFSREQRLQIAVVVAMIVTCAATIIWALRHTVYSDKVETYWRGDSVAVSTYWDSNRIVVTHLVMYDSEHSSATATLSEPRLIMESGGTHFDRQTLNQLVWKQRHGEIVPPPAKNTPVSAVYYHPAFSDFR